jgi:cytochrome b subunit of formate dehydrogenase
MALFFSLSCLFFSVYSSHQKGSSYQIIPLLFLDPVFCFFYNLAMDKKNPSKNSRSQITILGSLLIFLSLLAGAPMLWAQENEICLACHGSKDSGAPFVDVTKFSASTHGRNLCVSCHADAKELPHKEKLAPVNCGTCHRIETSIYLQSDHGRALSRGISQAATCTSCHGKTHTILSSRNPDSPVYRANIPKTCAVCHANTQMMKKFNLSERWPIDTYNLSVHGKAQREGILNAAVCSDCHGTHDLHAASNPASKVNRKNIPNTCGKCHENVRAVYVQSIHGKAAAAGIKEAPVCTDCHGEHTIYAVRNPASSVWIGSVTKTCSSCHESKRIVEKFGLPADRLATYMDTYHGLAAKGGDLRVANCASCHGWHDVLPPNDPRSSVNPKNLQYTCGKCHPGAQTRLIVGAVHGGKKAIKPFLIRWVEIFYLFIIPLVIGLMFIHNLGDFLRKLRSPQIHGDGEKELFAAIRLNANERFQHLVLIVDFMVLAYSGFSLKFSSAWWASPFAYAGGEALRRAIHRWTALSFILLMVYHLCYMLGTSRGRMLLTVKLRPRLTDAFDALRLLAYNYGLSKNKPTLKYPSFIERMEYGGLLWGAFIMILTGSFLVFSDFALKYFPLWFSDLATMIHLFEATLACLSILVWHFYWVIFDPEVYPMSWAWLTGSVRKKKTNDQ